MGIFLGKTFRQLVAFSYSLQDIEMVVSCNCSRSRVGAKTLNFNKRIVGVPALERARPAKASRNDRSQISTPPGIDKNLLALGMSMAPVLEQTARAAEDGGFDVRPLVLFLPIVVAVSWVSINMFNPIKNQLETVQEQNKRTAKKQR